MAEASESEIMRKAKTARKRLMDACAAHLKDLRLAHGKPPADVPLASRAIPQRPDPVATGSWCSSPAQMCAELAK